MTLTYGRSPFGPDRGSFDFQVPDQVAYVGSRPRRMRAVFAGATVLDTHWHLSDGTALGRVSDAAWSLPHPLAEAAAALEHVNFYPDKVEVLVDDRPAEP